MDPVGVGLTAGQEAHHRSMSAARNPGSKGRAPEMLIFWGFGRPRGGAGKAPE